MSSRRWCRLEQSEDAASRVALETADCLAHAFAFAEFALDVGDRRWMVLPAADDDRVQCAVELTIAAGIEPVANALTGARGDGRGAAEAREGRLAAAAAVVRPGKQRLGGRDWADAALGEQERREFGDTCLDLTFELAFFGAE